MSSQAPTVEENANYPGDVVASARRHFAAEWTIEEIRGLVEKDCGRRPSWHTVKCWVDPEFAERRRKAIRHTNRDWRLRRDGLRPLRQVSEEWRLARMLEMRSYGMPFKWVALVARLWWGEEVSEDIVERRLRNAAAEGRAA
jgi:hypothetical protein